MLEAKAMASVLTPSTTTLAVMTMRGPCRSASAPTTGCARPFTTQPAAATNDNCPTDTLKSSDHEGTKRPKLCRKPAVTKIMKKTAPTMYQP